VGFAVLASYVLSRTLVPTLVMWFYRHFEYHGHLTDSAGASWWLRPFVAVQLGFERGFARLKDCYGHYLSAVLRHRLPFAAAFLGFCIVTGLGLPELGQDFFPSVDTGQFRLHLRARSGTRVEETAKLTDQVEAAIRRELPASEIAGMLDNIGMPAGGIPLTYIDSGLIGTGDADILVSLRPGHQPTVEHVRRLRSCLNREFPGVTFYFLPADIVSQTINIGLPAPLDLQFVGRDQTTNRAVAARLADQLRQIPGVVDVRV
jgi:multidrug efflux pump subunit AcrB